ncbi:hypothetical protein OH77DRAFT_105695 [Trametes cingulata]|nr:hypothetical protein OH77DRAFT_105695 [Trametes cingulata]
MEPAAALSTIRQRNRIASGVTMSFWKLFLCCSALGRDEVPYESPCYGAHIAAKQAAAREQQGNVAPYKGRGGQPEWTAKHAMVSESSDNMMALPPLEPNRRRSQFPRDGHECPSEEGKPLPLLPAAASEEHPVMSVPTPVVRIGPGPRTAAISKACPDDATEYVSSASPLAPINLLQADCNLDSCCA